MERLLSTRSPDKRGFAFSLVVFDLDGFSDFFFSTRFRGDAACRLGVLGDLADLGVLTAAPDASDWSSVVIIAGLLGRGDGTDDFGALLSTRRDVI